MTRSVLGIDAAWTTSNPSGVALVIERASEWRLVKVASSYADFASHLDPSKSKGDFAADLLSASKAITGQEVTLIAADIPLARSAIVSRRYSDDQVSIA